MPKRSLNEEEDSDEVSLRNINLGAGEQRNYIQPGGSNNKQYNANTINFNSTEDAASPYKSLPVATDAPFDARSRQNDPLCLDGTRIEILAEIREWVYGNGSSCIFWLNGMAGTGKSTIARTLAEKFHLEKCLGASFFFVRGNNDVSHAGLFFTTIAAQLATRIPPLKRHIVRAVEQEPDIANKSRAVQWQQLIVQPLEELASSAQMPRIVLVVDALDECDNAEDVKGLVKLLARAGDILAVRLRIVITSRPETAPSLGFGSIDEVLHRDLLLHEVSRKLVDRDIRLFFHEQFRSVRHICRLREDWPGHQIIDELVDASAGLFIYAETVCRFLKEGNTRPSRALVLFLPQKKADKAMAQHQEYDNAGTTVFLDQTYSQILKQSARRYTARAHQDLKLKLGAVAALMEPLPPQALAALLDVEEEDIAHQFRDLHSVIQFPNDHTNPVRLFHASFRDFLFDVTRSDECGFNLEPENVHSSLLHCCFRVMKLLRQNMLSLEHPGIRVSEIDNGQIDREIPTHLRYACQFWVHHFCETRISQDEVHQFLLDHFLHWLEVMSMIRKTPEAVDMIIRLESHINRIGAPHIGVCQSSGLATPASKTLSDFLRDARRVVLLSKDGLAQAPLQVYEAALSWAPENSILRQHFLSRAVQRMKQLDETQQKKWDRCMHTLVGHQGMIRCAAFSSDGLRLASVSESRSQPVEVRLWEVASGRCIQIFTDHCGVPLDIVFTQDGKSIASLSTEEIRIWDLASGQSHKVQESETGQPRLWHLSAAIQSAPQSRELACVRANSTIKIYEAPTGQYIRETDMLERAPSGTILTLAFAQDGRTFASGSYYSVRIWDMISCRCLHQLAEYKASIRSLAFTRDGLILMSADTKGDVRMWNTATAQCSQTLSHDRTSLRAVPALTLGPDSPNAYEIETYSHVLASVSGVDTLVCTSSTFDCISEITEIWRNGLRTQTIGEPSMWSKALSLAPDGQTLALKMSSGSSESLTIWDIGSSQSEDFTEIMDRHENSVTALVFSPDSTLIASSSCDQTIRIWEPNGRCIDKIAKQSRGKYTLAFAPDSRTLAFGSRDIRIWDRSSRCIAVIDVPECASSICALDFAPDGQMFVSASENSDEALLWTKSGKHVRSFCGHTKAIDIVVFSQDGKKLASGARDGTVRIWTLGGHCVGTLKGQLPIVTALAFAPGGDVVVSAALGGPMRAWDLASQRCVQEVSSDISSYVSQLTFSADGTTVTTDHGHVAFRGLASSYSAEIIPRRSAFVRESWLFIDSQPLLWLPARFAGVVRCVMERDTVVLYHGSGLFSCWACRPSPVHGRL